MDTSSSHGEPKGLSHQAVENKFAGISTAENFSKYAVFDDLAYPDEILEKKRHSGASEQAPSDSAAAIYMRSLLNSRDHIFEATLRVTKIQFNRLAQWLRDHTGFEDSKRWTCAQRLMVALYIMGSGETQRNAARRFHMNQRCVDRIFSEVLSHLAKLHLAFVQMPGDTYVSDKINNDDKYSAFNGCIGAIDCAHVATHVPLAKRRRFRSPQGGITQKVLAAVAFDGRFVYVLAGGEGSLRDAAFLRIASGMRLNIPKGRFFVANTGFGIARRGIVCPFANTRYRVEEFAERGLQPKSPEELYNLTHSSLQVIVEKAFDMMTRRWGILRTCPPEYSLTHRIRLIYVATALHNFVLMDGLEPKDYIQRGEESLSPSEKMMRKDSLARADENVDEKTGKQLRDEIAKAFGENYA